MGFAAPLPQGTTITEQARKPFVQALEKLYLASLAMVGSGPGMPSHQDTEEAFLKAMMDARNALARAGVEVPKADESAIKTVVTEAARYRHWRDVYRQRYSFQDPEIASQQLDALIDADIKRRAEN